MGNGFSQPNQNEDEDQSNQPVTQLVDPDDESNREQESSTNEQGDQVDPEDSGTEEGALFGAMSYLNMYFGSGGPASSTNESFGFSGASTDAPGPNLADFACSTMKTPTIKAGINFLKPSLKLVCGEPNQFGLHFSFDSAAPGTIKILASENGNREHSQDFSEGSGQQYGTPLDLFNTSMFASEPGFDGAVYSVSIVLSVADTEFDIRTQTTLCSIVKVSDETFEAKVFKQTVMYSDLSYVVYDIFGLETGAALNEDCVICLSESKDTVLIPCRHLCICSHCAQVLKFQSNKCPICRASVRSMLTVNLTSPDADTEKTKVDLDVQIDSDTEHSIETIVSKKDQIAVQIQG